MRSKPKTKNALAHGLYANDLVLPWENEQDFVDLYHGIRRQLRPDGTLQDEVVLDIAQLHWRKRRVHIGMQLAYRGHPDADAMAKAGEQGWDGVGRYLDETSGKPERFSDHARAAAKAQSRAVICISEAIDKAMAPLAKGKGSPDSRDKIKGLTHLAGIVNGFSDHVVRALKYAEDYDLQQGPFQRAHRPDVLEKYSKIESHIDKQIDKALVRLVRLKEYDKMYPEVEVINPPAVEPAPPLSPLSVPEDSEQAHEPD
jgi:hypothetical protein